MNKNLKYELLRAILFTLYIEDKISFLHWQSILSKLSSEYLETPTNSLAIMKNEL